MSAAKRGHGGQTKTPPADPVSFKQDTETGDVKATLREIWCIIGITE